MIEAKKVREIQYMINILNNVEKAEGEITDNEYMLIWKKILNAMVNATRVKEISFTFKNKEVPNQIEIINIIKSYGFKVALDMNEAFISW